jgi:hypothetical protein
MALMDRVLRRRIGAKMDQLEAYRPFPVEVARKLEELVTVSMTYHSNAIEGSTMNLVEVDLALGGYRIPGEHTAEEIAETVGHARAWRLVEEDAASGRPMRAELVIELHDLVKPYDEQRGEWRKQQVYIRGALHVPPPAHEVPRYMDEWVRYVNKHAGDPVERAATAHAGFEAVHPFLDGNGRTGRLLLNWMLLRAGYPPAIIQVEERARYISALTAATPPGPLNYAPLAQLVAERVDASLTLYLSSMVPDDRFHEIGLEEAARRTGLTSRRLRGLAAEGKLEARRHGKRWVTWPAALDTYLQTRNPVGKPPAGE